MVFDRVKEKRIQPKEESYWICGPYSKVVKEGDEAMPEIQRLIIEEKQIEEHKLLGRKLMRYPVGHQKSSPNLLTYLNLE
jgi:hypothetical protein